MTPTLTGEQAHAAGADGARRAKLWLEATTRANVHWVNPDPAAVPKLQFPWNDGTTFSFDLGGTLAGGALHGQEFFAESKKYTNAGAQNKMYDEYLAKCYCALKHRPERCDHFLWITWAAFATTTWAELTTTKRVARAVKALSARALGVPPPDADYVIDLANCAAVASRLWVIVLSDKQEEHLVLPPEHQALIRAEVAKKAAMP